MGLVTTACLGGDVMAVPMEYHFPVHFDSQVLPKVKLNTYLFSSFLVAACCNKIRFTFMASLHILFISSRDCFMKYLLYDLVFLAIYIPGLQP